MGRIYFINPGFFLDLCLHKFHPSMKLLGSVGSVLGFFKVFFPRGMLLQADMGI